MSIELPPLALYVHLPWCVRKCPYCDFNSHGAPARIPETEYVDALLQDLETDLYAVQGRPLTSIFFGGGTPSLFSPAEIARFLESVRKRTAIAPDVEVTLEANPGAIEHGRFRGYRDAGVNRVSLGAQSFNDDHLRLLGRIHGGMDIARAIEELVRADLRNFNLDLMYALPAQSLEDAIADIETALALEPAHISHYQLTLEPGTAFYRRPPPLPDAEAAWRMQTECQARLARSGYDQYEVSAYARPGRQCAHNLNYWRFGDYLGLGAGAHGKVTVEGVVTRTVRVRQPRDYLARAPLERLSERSIVSTEQLPFEYMLNVLRVLEGFDAAAFEGRT
ncbi:MAG TPA: radical SAM family heme chaperone HemW, partial [Steroidobacter sp.]|nr:radical SAM family heme chaperone HemW [Steroidobacter sp.]